MALDPLARVFQKNLPEPWAEEAKAYGMKDTADARLSLGIQSGGSLYWINSTVSSA